MVAFIKLTGMDYVALICDKFVIASSKRLDSSRFV